MGNVSQVVPSLNPAFDIGTEAPLNSVAFNEDAGTDKAHGNVTIDLILYPLMRMLGLTWLMVMWL